MSFDISTYHELRKLGASEFQAIRTAQAIKQFEQGKISKNDLSIGLIFTELSEAGVKPVEARKIEVLFWSEYDKKFPPTPYEKGFIDFVEGKSDKLYNEINLI